MAPKFNFRIKAFIVFMILSILVYFFYNIIQYNVGGGYLNGGVLFSSLYAIYLSLFSILGLINFWLYVLAIFLFFKKKVWAWIFGAIPSLWVLFSPMISPSYPDAPSGTLLSLIYHFIHDLQINMPLMIILSIMAIIIISYVIIGLIFDIKTIQNERLDLIIGIIFIIFSIISVTELIPFFIGVHTKTALFGFDLRNIATVINTLVIIILYVGSIIAWNKLEPQPL